MIRSSQELNELYSALSIAQGSLKPASKDSKNPHFRSTYASLASVIEATQEALAKNDLSVIQLPRQEGESWILTTRLCHKSGQWIESDTPLINSKPDAQGFGSALTYARRYSLAAIVGITQDDDDANDASAPAPALKKQYETKVSAAKNEAPISQAQAKALFNLASKKGISTDTLKIHLKKYGVERSADLKVFQFQELTNEIAALQDANIDQRQQ
jgi:hypothetical protein